MIALNITALTQLTIAALSGFKTRNQGTIVNVGSWVHNIPQAARIDGNTVFPMREAATPFKRFTVQKTPRLGDLVSDRDDGGSCLVDIQRVHVGRDDDESSSGGRIIFRFLQPTICALTNGTGIGVVGWGRVWPARVVQL